MCPVFYLYHKRLHCSQQAREKSSTGMYHIMQRGIDKKNIFLDNQDREKFIDYI